MAQNMQGTTSVLQMLKKRGKGNEFDLFTRMADKEKRLDGQSSSDSSSFYEQLLTKKQEQSNVKDMDFQCSRVA